MSGSGSTQGRDLVRAASGGAAATMLGKVAYLATRVALPPLVLRHVGLEEYGLWSVAFVLVGYLGMGAFGVTNVYIGGVASARVRGDQDAINRLVSTGLAFTSIVAVSMFALLCFAMPRVVPMLGVPDSLSVQAGELFLAAAAVFLADLALGAWPSVLLGLEKVRAHQVLWVGGSAVEAVAIVALLEAGLGVHALPLAFALRTVLGLAAGVILCRRALPGLEVSLGHLDGASLRRFLGYGSIVQASGLLGMFLYSVEKLIAAVMLGPAAAAVFDIGEKFAVMASGIPASLNGVLLAPVARMRAAGGEGDWGPGYFVTATRWVSLPGGLLMALLAAFAPQVITAWMGPDPRLVEASLILAVFSAAFHAHVTTGPASAWYRGTSRPARELVYPLVQLALVALFVAGGFTVAGRSVPVLAWAVSTAMLGSALIYVGWTARGLGVRGAAMVHRVLLPGLLPYAAAFAARLLVGLVLPDSAEGRAAAFAALAVGGPLHVLLSAALIGGLVLDGEEKSGCRRLAARLSARLPRSRAAVEVLS